MFKTIMKRLIVTGMILGFVFGGSFVSWGENPLSATVQACGIYYTVTGTTNYLALRSRPGYENSNEIGMLYNGESVEYIDSGNGSYWYVYSPKLGMFGYVNKRYLASSGTYVQVQDCGGKYWVTGTTNYLALRSAPSYNRCNEIGRLYNGDLVYVQSYSGTYWYVFSEKLGMSGYVNSNYLS